MIYNKKRSLTPRERKNSHKRKPVYNGKTRSTCLECDSQKKNRGNLICSPSEECVLQGLSDVLQYLRFCLVHVDGEAMARRSPELGTTPEAVQRETPVVIKELQHLSHRLNGLPVLCRDRTTDVHSKRKYRQGAVSKQRLKKSELVCCTAKQSAHCVSMCINGSPARALREKGGGGGGGSARRTLFSTTHSISKGVKSRRNTNSNKEHKKTTSKPIKT